MYRVITVLVVVSMLLEHVNHAQVEHSRSMVAIANSVIHVELAKSVLDAALITLAVARRVLR